MASVELEQLEVDGKTPEFQRPERPQGSIHASIAISMVTGLATRSALSLVQVLAERALQLPRKQKRGKFV